MYTYTKKTISISLFLFMLSASNCVWAGIHKEIKKANMYYNDGQFEKAQIEYQKLLDQKKYVPQVHYNSGNALYKQKRFKESVDEFRLALLGGDPILQHKVRYNLANALFYYGLAVENDDLDTAIKSLEETLQHYDEFRLRNESGEKVLFNRPVVEKELERMKRKKNSQASDQQQQSNDKNERKQDKNQQQNQDNQQSQQGQDQQNQQEQQNQQSQQGDDEQSGGQNQENSGNDQENANNRQENQNAESSQEQEQSQQQMDQQASEGDPSAGDNNAQNQKSYQSYRMEAMTKEEAKMMLEDYEQNQEPKGMLNFINRKRKMQSTYQDW